MNEWPSVSHEDEHEKIPTIEAVRSVLEEMLVLADVKEVRRCEDKDGLYLWEVALTTEEGSAEYSYARAGRFPEGHAASTAIHVTYFDEDDFPMGGDRVASFKEGTWVLV